MTLTLSQRTALVVVDLQSGTTAAPQTHAVRTVAANVERLAHGVRSVAGQVVFVRHHPALKPSGAVGRHDCPREQPVAYGNLIVKRENADWNYVRGGWSAFSGTDLERRLKARGVRDVVVVGQGTSAGIESTVRAAYDLGFDVVTVEDATNDPEPTAHADRFHTIFTTLGRTARTEDLIAGTR